MNSALLFSKITLAAVWRTDLETKQIGCSGPGERCLKWDGSDKAGKKSRIQYIVWK